ncbi:hypothetical protein ABPG74_006724 [Tetrahymena malaccensis]
MGQCSTGNQVLQQDNTPSQYYSQHSQGLSQGFEALKQQGFQGYETRKGQIQFAAVQLQESLILILKYFQEAIISKLRQQNSQLEQQNKSFKDIQKKLENELQVLKNQRGQMEATLFESNQTNNLLKQEIEKLKQTQKMLVNDLKTQFNSKQNIQTQNQYQSTNSQQQIKKKEEEALKKQMQEEQEKQIQQQKASNNKQDLNNYEQITYLLTGS